MTTSKPWQAGNNTLDSAYLEDQLRRIIGIGPSKDAARRQARLAVIIANLMKDTCYEHGGLCTTQPDCWAREIIARSNTWA